MSHVEIFKTYFELLIHIIFFVIITMIILYILLAMRSECPQRLETMTYSLKKNMYFQCYLLSTKNTQEEEVVMFVY